MLKRVVISLVLGAATTIAVAWASAVWVDARDGRLAGSLRDDELHLWTYWIFETRTATLVQRIPEVADPPPIGLRLKGSFAGRDQTSEPQLPSWSVVHVPPRPSDFDAMGSFIEDARGWPMRCLIAHRTILNPEPASAPGQELIRWGIKASEGEIAATGMFTWPSAIVLPLKPLWSGFAVNSAVYAAAWSLIVVVPWGLRRRLRDRRGACPYCGYDLRYAPDASARCPECGVMR